MATTFSSAASATPASVEPAPAATERAEVAPEPAEAATEPARAATEPTATAAESAETATPERPGRWVNLVRVLTDPREARADLHAMDLGTTRSTWT